MVQCGCRGHICTTVCLPTRFIKQWAFVFYGGERALVMVMSSKRLPRGNLFSWVLQTVLCLVNEAPHRIEARQSHFMSTLLANQSPRNFLRLDGVS